MNDIATYAASYYGTADRYESDNYKHKVISQIKGLELAIAEFSDADESREYSSMCSEIKGLVTNIKQRQGRWDLNMTEYKLELRTKWFPLFRVFISRWGKEMVPHDLREMIEEVRVMVYGCTQSWPNILLIGDHGTLTTRVLVDRRGCMVDNNN